MKLTKREQRNLQEGESQPSEVQPQYIEPEKKSYKKHIIVSIISIVVLFSVYGVYSYAKPGRYDDFARCLTEQGVEVYGAMNWCKYTQAQKGMFGKSFNLLNYQEYEALEGIKTTPTWIVDGKWYENVQSLDRLSELTGCEI
tara:strand:- start:1696 stop:2121 length:426 start_codon:yes stop_codon:yes gene_type:complete